MISQLPGGGLSSSASVPWQARRDQLDLMAEMERLYLDGVHERGQAAGYGRHVRFEHGTVRELAPAAPARTARWEQLAGRTRAAARSTGDRGDVPLGAVPRRAGRAAKRGGLR